MNKTIIQRLRFGQLDSTSVPSDMRDKLPAYTFEKWLQKERSLYWKIIQGTVDIGEDEIVFSNGAHLSSDTFFNAFFISYWKRLTRLSALSLSIEIQGKFRIEVFQVDEIGERVIVDSREIETGSHEFEFDLERLNGLRLAISLEALSDRARFSGGSWWTGEECKPARLTVVIPTIERNTSIRRMVRHLLSDPLLNEESIRVVVVDHNPVSDLESLNEERCRVIPQRNLGGVGGWTRGVIESLSNNPEGNLSYFLMMDDDIEPEIDSILRILRFAQFSRKPFIASGIMLDIYCPTISSYQGESFLMNDLGFHEPRRSLANTDLSDLGGMNAFSIPHAFDFPNRRFFCIPEEVFRQGIWPRPFFLKALEEVEFSRRAATLGFPIYALSGVGGWHQSYCRRISSDWKQQLSWYHLLVHHCLYDYQETANFFYSMGAGAITSLRDGKYRKAAVLIHAFEDFLGGWKFFSTRTYPDCIAGIQSKLELYTVENRNPNIINKTELAELRRRLEGAAARWEQEGRIIHAEFSRNLPATGYQDAWRRYFLSGNLSHVLESEAVEAQ